MCPQSLNRIGNAMGIFSRCSPSIPHQLAARYPTAAIIVSYTLHSGHRIVHRTNGPNDTLTDDEERAKGVQHETMV
jgi:hypothetical protein